MEGSVSETVQETANNAVSAVSDLANAAVDAGQAEVKTLVNAAAETIDNLTSLLKTIAGKI